VCNRFQTRKHGITNSNALLLHGVLHGVCYFLE
jgi:hypothetical protein